MEKFKNVPIDEDTIIKSSRVIKLDQLEALHQKWVWEGIVAESLIFHEKDIQELNDNQLFEIVIRNDIVPESGKITLKRDSSEYTFLNFNFENPL